MSRLVWNSNKISRIYNYFVSADNSSPIVGSFSPASNTMCDQNQVNATLDGLSQDLQQNPMSPMQQTQQQQQAQPQQSSPQQSSRSQLTDMPNMVDSIIDPYRRTGNFFITLNCH